MNDQKNKSRFIFLFIILSFVIIHDQCNAELLLKGNYMYYKPQFDKVHFYNNRLIAFMQNNKWGFMNANGRILFSPQFDSVDVVVFDGTNIMGQEDKVYNNIIQVMQNKKIGFIDNNGNYIASPIFDKILNLDPYFDILVVQQDNKIGFINLKNNKVIKPQYDEFKFFNDTKSIDLILQSTKINIYTYWNVTPLEYIAVKMNNKWGLIDLNGKYFIDPKYDNYQNIFFDSSFQDMINNKINILKSTKTKNDKNINANNTITIVQSNDKYKLYFHIQGKSIEGKNTYDNAFLLSDDESCVAVQLNGKWGIIDNHGKWVLKLQFEAINRFSEDLAAVKFNKKWGYIDKSYNIVIKPQFDSATSFSEGLAAIKLNNKWGFINKSGKIIIEPKFDEVKSFNEDYAAIKINKKWGFINKNGKIIAKPQFDNVNDFFNGMSLVEINKYYGVIDTTGEYILKPQFKDNSYLIIDNINYTYRYDNSINDIYKYDSIHPSVGLIISNNGKIGLLLKSK